MADPRSGSGRAAGQQPTRDLARHLPTIPGACEGASTLAASRGDVVGKPELATTYPAATSQNLTCYNPSGTDVDRTDFDPSRSGVRVDPLPQWRPCQCVQNESAHGVIRLPAHPRVDLRSLRLKTERGIRVRRETGAIGARGEVPAGLTSLPKQWACDLHLGSSRG
jgi:hypothetical protein